MVQWCRSADPRFGSRLVRRPSSQDRGPERMEASGINTRARRLWCGGQDVVTIVAGAKFGVVFCSQRHRDRPIADEPDESAENILVATESYERLADLSRHARQQVQEPS